MRRLFAAALALAPLPAFADAPGRWRALDTKNGPGLRARHAAVYGDGRIMVWGGTNDAGYTGTGAVYDVAAGTWRPMPEKDAPKGRESFDSAWTGKELLVWGGYHHAPKGQLNTGGLYDPKADKWRPTSIDGAPAPRQGMAAAFGDGKLYVFGGTGEKVYGDGFSYDPAKDAWRALPAKGAPSARTGASAAWADGRFVVWGGNIGWLRRGAFLGDGAVYDPKSDTWTAIPAKGAPSARANAATHAVGGKVLIVGGNDESKVLKNGALYDPQANAWTAVPAPGFTLRALVGDDKRLVALDPDFHARPFVNGKFGAPLAPTVKAPFPPRVSEAALTLAGDALFLYGGYVSDPSSKHGNKLGIAGDAWLMPLQ